MKPPIEYRPKKQAAAWDTIPPVEAGNAGGSASSSGTKFDRAKYQREYMRKKRKQDRKEADARGITVTEYRYRRSKGEIE